MFPCDWLRFEPQVIRSTFGITPPRDFDNQDESSGFEFHEKSS